jgi:hypothetical protein
VSLLSTHAGGRSGLPTRIVTTESGSLCTRMKVDGFVELKSPIPELPRIFVDNWARFFQTQMPPNCKRFVKLLDILPHSQ